MCAGSVGLTFAEAFIRHGRLAEAPAAVPGLLGVLDDPRFIDAAERLLGGPVIPECPEGILYFAEAGWHTDDGIGVRGVKFAAYFDQLTAASGALRLVPGSHHPEQGARLAAYERRQPRVRTDADAAAYRASTPGYVAGTSPGDVIVFDLHTWHASFGGGADGQLTVAVGGQPGVLLRVVRAGHQPQRPGIGGELAEVGGELDAVYPDAVVGVPAGLGEVQDALDIRG